MRQNCWHIRSYRGHAVEGDTIMPLTEIEA
jgi:hypothetical protein